METIDLNLVRTFAAVAEEGSFSGGADRLGVPRSTASRAVAKLEEDLGVRLFHRTTRKVAITTAGRALLDRVQPSLDTLESALRDLPEREEAPSGTLRVTTTADLAATVMADAIVGFARRHPAVRVELHLSHGLVDLVREGFDLAVRVHRSALRDSSLVARNVGTIALGLYASPSYLARRGTPKRASELASHDAIGFRGAPSFMAHGRGGREVALPSERVLADDMLVARELLRSGGGLGALPTFLGEPDVTQGRLVRVLPKVLVRTGRVSLVHPSRAHVPKKVSAFRDALIDVFRAPAFASIPER